MVVQDHPSRALHLWVHNKVAHQSILQHHSGKCVVGYSHSELCQNLRNIILFEDVDRKIVSPRIPCFLVVVLALESRAIGAKGLLECIFNIRDLKGHTGSCNTMSESVENKEYQKPKAHFC